MGNHAALRCKSSQGLERSTNTRRLCDSCERGDGSDDKDANEKGTKTGSEAARGSRPAPNDASIQTWLPHGSLPGGEGSNPSTGTAFYPHAGLKNGALATRADREPPAAAGAGKGRHNTRAAVPNGTSIHTLEEGVVAGSIPARLM